MKGKLTRFLSLIMCAAVTFTSISLSDYGTVRANANTGGSAELPSVTKYATKNDLTDKSKFSLWRADGGVAQKVYFGYDSTNEVARTWYIAGKDGDGSLVLMCDPTNTFGNQMFNETLDKSSYESNEVYANHYGASDIRKYLSGDALNSFSSKEQDLMIDKEILSNDTKNSSTYLTSDKLYLAYGDYQDRYITVGANSKNSLNSGIKIGLNSNGSTGSAYIDSENGGFWLRAPYARFNYDAQFAGPGYDVSPFCVTNSAAVVPAFNLNLSSVLFASAAKATSSQSKLEDAMTFRIDAKDKIQSTAEYNANQINVSKGTDSGELYLYVQGKDSTGEWVWSEKVPSDGELFDIADIRSGLSTTASCKIWLETQNGNDNLVYAKEALETQKIFRRINVKANDNIMGKASAIKK